MTNISQLETFIADNGIRYYIDPLTGKAKKFADYDNKGFHLNKDAKPLDAELAKENTKLCAKFLRKTYKEVVFDLKSGFLKYKGFRIKYISHGFCIQDTLQGFKTININEWNNDYPEPSDVLLFLQNNADKPVVHVKTAPEKIAVVEKLSEKFKVKAKVEKDVVVERDELVQKIRECKPRLVTHFDQVIEHTNLPQAEFSTVKFIGLCKKISQQKGFIYRLKLLCGKYKKSSITRDNFVDELRTMIEDRVAPKPQEVPKKLRKYPIPYSYLPQNLKMDGDMMEFDQETHTGDMVKVKTHKILYYANLMYFADKEVWLDFVMAIACGDILVNREFYDGLDILNPYSVNRYSWDESVILTSPAIPALMNFCEKVFRHLGVHTYKTLLYDHPTLKKGDTLRVFFPFSQSAYDVRITSLNPAKVLYISDGVVEPLYNFLEFEVRG